MKQGSKVLSILTIVSSILIVLFTYLRAHIVNLLSSQNSGAKVFLGGLLIIPYILYTIVLVLFVCQCVKNFKKRRALTVISALITAASILLCTVFPYSTLCAKLHIKIFQNNITAVASALEANEQALYQVGPGKYCLPCRFASYNGTMYLDRSRDGSNLKILLCLFQGFRGGAFLIYSSTDIPPTDEDFDFLFPYGDNSTRFGQAERLYERWYYILTDG